MGVQKKEPFKQRITAEAYYNELFSLETRKKELVNELAATNKRLEELNRMEICNDAKTIAISRSKQ